MQLYYSAASPFVRKVLVVAHELGCADKIELISAAAHPVNTNSVIAALNPLGQVPTLATDTGRVICDSRVICEYLNTQFHGTLLPIGSERWTALVMQSHADGLLDAALLARYERVVRPVELQWDDWEAGQMAKIVRTLDVLELELEFAGERLDIGTIAVGCALGYLDFRFADFNWRDDHAGLAAWFERFSQRASMQQTVPKG